MNEHGTVTSERMALIHVESVDSDYLLLREREREPFIPSDSVESKSSYLN